MSNRFSVIALVALFAVPNAFAQNPHPSCFWCHPSTTGTSSQAAWNLAPATPQPIAAPSIDSLCLGCHDGSMATTIQNHDTGIQQLSGNHPTAVDYRLAEMTGKDLRSPWDPSGLGSTIERDLLIDGHVECVSCHDVHNSQRPDLLVMSNGGSALCLTCHDK